MEVWDALVHIVTYPQIFLFDELLLEFNRLTKSRIKTCVCEFYKENRRCLLRQTGCAALNLLARSRNGASKTSVW